MGRSKQTCGHVRFLSCWWVRLPRDWVSLMHLAFGGISCACQRHDGPEELRRLTLEAQGGREGLARRDRACILGERRTNHRNPGQVLANEAGGLRQDQVRLKLLAAERGA